MIYYVSVNGNDRNEGSREAPFRTINRAAKIAAAGDTVRVHGGVYREWVDPQNGGYNAQNRVVYEAVAGEHPIIKGSEVVTDWERVEGSVWKKAVPNSVFGDFNPFAEELKGDWMVMPTDYAVHLGDVYLNGVSLYEAKSLSELKAAEKRLEGQYRHRFKAEYILHPEQTVYQWYAEVGEDETVLYCNFQEVDPNHALTEISVRRSCFYPCQVGVNYITVRGFEMAHAATPFSPPTADQPGMLGPHWSKGWIIENNHLHDAKCSAISLGKEISTGHNFHTRFLRKPGYQYQMEAVFLALQAGWSKEKIGSHIVRNNIIHDCGQNGIVGHMGAAFSRIEHNHIYNITKKQEFFGEEIGGIKLHAAVDVVIENNHFHHCCLGTWLDWQAQGTRVTKNIYHHNDRDLFIEVTHGPCLVDNNLFLSEYTLDDAAQGSAFVHNLIGGYIKHYMVLDRATPYHFPHSTAVAGTTVVCGGDDRIYNNIILGDYGLPSEKLMYWGSGMDGYTTKEEYVTRIREQGTHKDIGKFLSTPQPVWFGGNAYTGFAKPQRAEEDPILCTDIRHEIAERDGKWILHLAVPPAVVNASCEAVSTERLGSPRITEEPFENPDGTPVDFSKDFFCRTRKENIIPGPFASLCAGDNTFVVWED